MNEEQKKYKILKKESYEKNIKKEKDNATQLTAILGVSALAAILMGVKLVTVNDDVTTRFYEFFGSLAMASAGAFSLKGLINSIVKKTILESKIEDINSELELLELKSKRGTRK